MRSPILVVGCLALSTLGYTQGQSLSDPSELKGRIEKSRDGNYTLVLEGNKRVRLTSLPSALVSESEPSSPPEPFSSEPSDALEPAEELTWPDVIYSFQDGPSLATISEEETTRRESVGREGQKGAWKVTGVELLRYSRTKPVRMRCTPVR